MEGPAAAAAAALGPLAQRCALALLLAAAAVVALCRFRFARIRGASVAAGSASTSKSKSKSRDRLVAFWHPDCAAGGGGERVLWMALRCLGEMREAGLPVRAAVYTADPIGAGGEGTYRRGMLEHASARFGVGISPDLPLTFVPVGGGRGGGDRPVRRTLAGEAARTAGLAWGALSRCCPDVYVDTTGAAFAYPVARILAGCRVAAYVHYPFVSTDMLALVWERRPSPSHGHEHGGGASASASASTLRTHAKLAYYTLLAVAYGAVGGLCHLAMANSSWTGGHVRSLWRWAAARGRVRVVFPPCDTRSLEDLPLGGREDVVLSIGQFRPEKDHALQLRAFARMLERYPEMRERGPRLVLLGSCRGEADEARVRWLRGMAGDLGVGGAVEFVLNQPYPVLRGWLGRASAGLHTMWNEHFGIGVVEMMAAGLVAIAHDSGGPRADIVVPAPDGGRTGYLASTVDGYADAMHLALGGGPDCGETLLIRRRARESAKRFSDQVFADSFKRALIESGILR